MPDRPVGSLPLIQLDGGFAIQGLEYLAGKEDPV